MIKRFVIGAAILGLLAAGAYWRFHSRPRTLTEAFSGDRRVIVWSGTAEVREPLSTLGYGERVEILTRAGDNVEVRTAQGLVGWVDSHQLLDIALWHRAEQLNAQAKLMPVQARGHTKVVSNLRIEPGRDAQRILQLGREVSVEILARQALDAPTTTSGDQSEEGNTPKREDWLLVRAQTKDFGELSGWVVGRFVDLDLPPPLPDYATSAGMHVVGWFVLNNVADKDGSLKPQYLVIGTRGGEGQACDFTLLRVYTWSAARPRYETAFVESDACGKLPVRVTPAAQPGGDATFRFSSIGGNDSQETVYRMHQTIVRRVRESGPPTGKRPRR
jgi:hypothetical protein